MSGLSKVIVLDPDVRASRQIQLGFEREGLPAAAVPVPLDAGKLDLFGGNGRDASLVVVGGTTEAKALELIRRAKGLLDDAHVEAPIVFAGRGVRRTDAEAAGADEVVLQPAHLRDVITVGRLLRGTPSHQRRHLVGNLAETTGVFTLVRALSALGRSAVLTLIRGLRRGEVRFYHGEVTSAQVGLIHGQAALHQLLLWTDARFDFRHEDVVRRQQIPMSHDELFADAEMFLSTVRASAGALSPSMVLEQDVARIHQLGKQIPTEVHGVLRMFDGHRVLADVLEDSPYRVFETLRVSQRAMDVGLLRQAQAPRPKATWRAVLAIEEWLVGSDREQRPKERAPSESGPMKTIEASAPHMKGSRRKRKKRRANTPVNVPAIQTKPDIDWGALVPRVVGGEVGPLAGVVPASHASGEIVLPPSSREEPRERLEALMDTDKREKIFARDIGIEPKVVWDEQEVDRVRSDAEAGLAAEPTVARTPSGEIREEAKSEVRELVHRMKRDTADASGADELAKRLAKGREGGEAAQLEKARLEADAKAAVEMAARAVEEAAAKARAEEALAKSEAEAALAKVEAERARAAETKAELARHAAQREAEAAERAAAAEREASVKAEAERVAAAIADANAKADAERVAAAVTEAERAAVAQREAAARAEAETAARAEAEASTRREAEAAARRDAEAAIRADAEATARREADAAARAEAEATARREADARVEAERAAAAEAEAAARREAEAREAAQREAERAAAELARSEEERRRAEANAIDADAKREAEAREAAQREAEEKAARREAEAHEAKLRADALQRADDDARQAAAMEAKLRASSAATEDAEHKARLAAEAKAAADRAEAEVRAAQERTRIAEQQRGDSKRNRAAKREAKRRDTLEAKAIAHARAEAEARVIAQAKPGELGDEERTAPRKRVDTSATDLVRQLVATSGELTTTPAVVVAETPSTTVMVADVVNVTSTETTARLVATPIATVTEARADAAAARLVASPVEPSVVVEAAPTELVDEPSDGVIRESLDSERRKPPPPRVPTEVPDDRPEDTTGEITSPILRDEAKAEPEPSILVSDLVAVHTAVSAIATAQVQAPPTPNAATISKEHAVAAVRDDAQHAFSDVEEAFFAAAEEPARPHVKHDSFDDLDEGYQPVGFWDRLLGRKKPPPRR